MIIDQLKQDHTKIHVINRAQIIDDALNLARSGLLDYQVALGITSYLHKETEYIPWAAALSNMGYISSMLKRSAAYGPFRKYMRYLVDPLYTRVGFELRPDDQSLDVFLRRLALGWSCGMGNEECLEKVKGEFKIWRDKINPDDEEANP